MSSGPLRSVAELRAGRPLRVPEALGLLRDVATALAAAHANGMVHGAVCLENIVVDERGAARLCRDTPTPPATSPEQRRGAAPDARSDVFALGAAVAELLSDAPSVPEPVRRLLATMTAEDPAVRPQTMDEVLLGLEACELMTGLRGFRPGQGPSERPSSRRLLPLIVLGLSLVVLGLALAALLGRTPPGRGEAPESHKPLLDKMVPVPPRPLPAPGP